METTYKIIGGDGEEYGPVTLAELKNWVVDGRVAGRTRVQRSNAEDWLPAARLLELQPEVGHAVPGTGSTGICSPGSAPSGGAVTFFGPAVAGSSAVP